MDWQEMAALTITALTAGVLLASKLRRRKMDFARKTHCGCHNPEGVQAKGSIIFHARRGERGEIVVKCK